jgi:hypothetical protein
MPAGRPPFRFLLIDLPGDHEVDDRIASECDMIHAILHNRGLGTQTKLVRATTKQVLDSRGKPYAQVGYVHLGTHGGKGGIGFIGESASWKYVERKLKVFAPALRGDQKRVLCLSCCHSRNGVNAMELGLAGHFSGIYYFDKVKIGFATAMTVWSMFYRRKTIQQPTRAVVESINLFFGEDTLRYRALR